MSGRDRGFMVGFGACLRVAGTLIYVPAHFKNGKKISQKVTIPSMVNTGKTTRSEGRVDTFQITAWGRLADTICKSFNRGRAFDATLSLHSFDKKLWKFVTGANGGTIQPLVDAQGQQVVCPNFIGFTINQLVMGEEAQKMVNQEIMVYIEDAKRGVPPGQRRGRGPNWAVTGHPEAEELRAKRAALQARTFDPNSQTFGYARVMMVPDVDMGAYQNQNSAGQNVSGQTAQYAQQNVGGQMAQYAQGQNQQSFPIPEYEPAPQLEQTVRNAVNSGGSQQELPVYQSSGQQGTLIY